MRRTVFSIAPLAAAALAVAASVGCQTTEPPPSANALRTRGAFYVENEQYDLAFEEYRQLADRFPGDADAQQNLGIAALEINRLDEARRALEIAHVLDPENIDTADALAEVLLRQNDDDRLYVFLREQAESAQTTYAYLRWSNYARRLGDADTARLAIETAIELDDTNAVEPYHHAAALAIQVQDRARAWRRLRQAYGLDPRNPDTIAMIRQIGEIPGPSIALPPGR